MEYVRDHIAFHAPFLTLASLTFLTLTSLTFLTLGKTSELVLHSLNRKVSFVDFSHARQSEQVPSALAQSKSSAIGTSSLTGVLLSHVSFADFSTAWHNEQARSALA
jgi:hypothetical protein